MRIKYSLDASDYLKFQLFLASRSKQVKRRRNFTRWFIPILYILMSLVFFGIEQPITMIVFAALAIIWFFLYPIYSRNRYLRYYRKHIQEHHSSNFNKDFFIETKEDEFYLEAEEANSNIKYSAVKNIFDLSSHYLIQLKPGSVVILPVEKTDAKDLNSLIEEISLKSKIAVQDMKIWRWK
jgi:hypothetical protein